MKTDSNSCLLHYFSLSRKKSLYAWVRVCVEVRNFFFSQNSFFIKPTFSVGTGICLFQGMFCAYAMVINEAPGVWQFASSWKARPHTSDTNGGTEGDLGGGQKEWRRDGNRGWWRAGRKVGGQYMCEVLAEDRLPRGGRQTESREETMEGGAMEETGGARADQMEGGAREKTGRSWSRRSPAGPRPQPWWQEGEAMVEEGLTAPGGWPMAVEQVVVEPEAETETRWAKVTLRMGLTGDSEGDGEDWCRGGGRGRLGGSSEWSGGFETAHTPQGHSQHHECQWQGNDLRGRFRTGRQFRADRYF